MRKHRSNTRIHSVLYMIIFNIIPSTIIIYALTAYYDKHINIITAITLVIVAILMSLSEIIVKTRKNRRKQEEIEQLEKTWEIM